MQLTLFNRGAHFYRIDIKKALQPGEETSLQVGVAYVDRFSPSPEYASQKDSQLLVFDETRYAFSAYPSAEQVLKIGYVLLTSKIEYGNSNNITEL